MGTMAVVWHMSSGRGVRYPPEQHMGTMAGVCEPRKTRRMGPHPSSTWALRPESANQEKRGGCFSRGCRSWAERGGETAVKTMLSPTSHWHFGLRLQSKQNQKGETAVGANVMCLAKKV